jgi:biotin transport system substrate-specific component
VASLLIYAFGVGGLMAATGLSLGRAIELGVLPFLALDVAKAALAGLLLPGAWAVVRRLDQRSGD